MSKKSSSGSLLSFVIRWPRTDPLLVCGRRRPGRSLRVALWSSRRRLWELARRSKNSSVFGDATDGAVMKGKKSESLKKKNNSFGSNTSPMERMEEEHQDAFQTCFYLPKALPNFSNEHDF